MGYKIVIYPNEAHRAAIWAAQECVRHLRERGTTEGFEYMIDFPSREEIVGTAGWQDMEKRYLSSKS